VDAGVAMRVRALNAEFTSAHILRDGKKASLLIRRAALFLDHTHRFSTEAREGMHGLVEVACRGIGNGDLDWSDDHAGALVRWQIFCEL